MLWASGGGSRSWGWNRTWEWALEIGCKVALRVFRLGSEVNGLRWVGERAGEVGREVRSN